MTHGLALYSGYAGLDLGIAIAEPGYRTVCYVEREAGCAANLVARMATQELCEAPVWDDSGTFDGLPWRGKVDIVTAGFPCPEVSTAGKRKGIHGERWLWGDVARIVREVEPRACLFENVRGILSANAGAAHAQVLGDMAEMGFDVVWGSVPASIVGASHKRDRIYYVAKPNREKRKGRWQGSSKTGRKIPAGFAGLGGGSMGNPKGDDGRCQQQSGKQGEHGWSGPAGTGGDVGHAACVDQGKRESGSSRKCKDRGSSAFVGNADCQRCGEAGQCDCERVDWYGGGLPFSPPGPNAEQAWLDIIGKAPAEALPAFYGMADGSSKRMDRLRMCGNGVYPLAATYAWLAGQAVLATATEER